MIEVVANGVLEVAERPDSVQLSVIHYGGRTTHKVECVECGRHICPDEVTWTEDGAVCPGCRDESD